jgi:hypothetical protein
MTPLRSTSAILPLLLCTLLTSCSNYAIPDDHTPVSTASGNWDLYGQYTGSRGSTTTSGELIFGGSLIQANTQVSGVFHIDTPCFGNSATDVPYTGTLINNTINITSSPVAGQTLTLQGTLSQNDTVLFTAAFEINGGCTGNLYSPALTFTVNSYLDQKGVRIPSLTGSWTPDLNLPFSLNLTERLTQSPTPDAHGDLALTGTVTVAGSPCFTTGTLQPSSFVSGALGQQIILMNDGSTITSTLALETRTTFAKPSLDLNGTITGGNCNGPIDVQLQ